MSSPPAERASLIVRSSYWTRPAPSLVTQADSYLKGQWRPLSRLAWIAATSSLLIHVILLLLMTAWLISVRQQETPSVIQTRLTDDSPHADLIDLTKIEEVEIVPQQPDSLQTADAAELAGSEFQPALAAVNLAFPEGRPGQPSGVGQGGRVEFFGTGAEGHSFIFIVDCSGSMEGGRFYRAIRELLAALRQLDRGQEFFVVFYNDSAIPLFRPREINGMVPASRSMRKRAVHWIRAQRARGGTQPEEAMLIALRLKPDVVYFLTDGEIPAETRELARNFNIYDSVIHTIAFETRAGEAILKGIAADNHGRYRFVD